MRNRRKVEFTKRTVEVTNPDTGKTEKVERTHMGFKTTKRHDLDKKHRAPSVR